MRQHYSIAQNITYYRTRVRQRSNCVHLSLERQIHEMRSGSKKKRITAPENAGYDRITVIAILVSVRRHEARIALKGQDGDRIQLVVKNNDVVCSEDGEEIRFL